MLNDIIIIINQSYITIYVSTMYDSSDSLLSLPTRYSTRAAIQRGNSLKKNKGVIGLGVERKGKRKCERFCHN